VSLMPVPLPGLLERCVQVLQANSTHQEQQISLVCDPIVPPVLADGDRVLQILTILFDFATERVTGGGSVVVTVKVEQPSVCVEVWDTGPDLVPQECEQVLAGFHHSSGDNVAGGDPLGLNIAIARGLAELQGGDVDLRCSVGAGTTLRLTLPIFQQQELAG